MCNPLINNNNNSVMTCESCVHAGDTVHPLVIKGKGFGRKRLNIGAIESNCCY